MSIQQAIIASAVGEANTSPSWTYPPPGNGYPVFIGGVNAMGIVDTPSGYYESLTNPQVGLFRRTYDASAIGFVDSTYTLDPNFPGSYSATQQFADAAVGFASGSDVATNFSMEWLGYFKPASSGNYLFRFIIDDYAMMWIGGTAVSGFDNSNAIIYANNEDVSCIRQALTADKYYPVRIRYTEGSGAHNCSIGIQKEGGNMNTNQYSTDGQFFYDASLTNAFPDTGLVV